MNSAEYEHFTDEGHSTISRSDKFWCDILSDMVIKQSLVGMMKTLGGLTCEREIQKSVPFEVDYEQRTNRVKLHGTINTVLRRFEK